MNWFIILANVCGWPILQLSIAWAITHVSPDRFVNTTAIGQVRSKEVQFYRQQLHIRQWKSRLPDGAMWVGGTFPRKRLHGSDPLYLSRFVAETRRSELAHWIMVACCPIFFLWNPVWAWPILACYAVASNGPCIVVQRYNRASACGLLSRYSKRAFSS
jgi:glycosyl-4,4'-diaponeurosporenoate acyltransferase